MALWRASTTPPLASPFVCDPDIRSMLTCLEEEEGERGGGGRGDLRTGP